MKKGFTLVELLAVVLVLAIIAVLAGMSYTKINKDNKLKACKALETQIKNTAIEYYQDNPLEYIKAGETKGIKLQDMINKQILPITSEEFTKITQISFTTTIVVRVTKDENGSYSAQLDYSNFCGRV